MQGPQDVLDFWLKETRQEEWYNPGDTMDATIRSRFEETWQAARDGGLKDWLNGPESTFAYIILCDQFPRNMFRGEAKAFATDKMALCASLAAIDRKWDKRVDEPERQFVYMPLMHSESLADQERCVRLMCTNMPETGRSNLLHAKAHREIIRKFGRFPFRNEALARAFTKSELSFIDEGGYSNVLKDVA